MIIDPSVIDSAGGYVLSTNWEGAVQAVEHLLSLGHRRIGYVGGQEGLVISLERRRGYEDALRQTDIALDQLLMRTGDYTQTQGRRCAEE